MIIDLVSSLKNTLDKKKESKIYGYFIVNIKSDYSTLILNGPNNSFIFNKTWITNESSHFLVFGRVAKLLEKDMNWKFDPRFYGYSIEGMVNNINPIFTALEMLANGVGGNIEVDVEVDEKPNTETDTEQVS